jgi:hypothetical protein
MKHLKKFNEKVYIDLAEDIARDLYPQLVKMRKEGKVITPEFFESFMKERGSNIEYIDAVTSILVDMGFDFDIETEEDWDEKPFDVRYVESLSYSGDDVTKMPVIGKVITKPIGPFDSSEYNVVEIIKDHNGDDVYVCDFWYKEWKRIPQLIHSELVSKFESL